MSELISTFGLAFDSLIEVKVRARNSITLVNSGWGALSPVNTIGARVRVIPSMLTADPIIVSYSDQQITISWGTLSSPSNGNSAIISYQLFYGIDGTALTTPTQLTSSLSTYYTLSGVTGGSTYGFNIRAVNIYGNGPFRTTAVTTDAIDVPDQVAIPTVALDGVDPLSVTLTWSAPIDHSSAITLYQVELVTAIGGTPLIDGSLVSCSPGATLTCTVTMADIRT
jgi:hypothetical protein